MTATACRRPRRSRDVAARGALARPRCSRSCRSSGSRSRCSPSTRSRRGRGRRRGSSPTRSSGRSSRARSRRPATRRGAATRSSSSRSTPIVIAPFWGIHSTATAYAAIKYVNAVVMTLAAVPTYLLARMLLPKRTSLVVALARRLHPRDGVRHHRSSRRCSATPGTRSARGSSCARSRTRGRSTSRLARGRVVCALLVRAPQFATVPRVASRSPPPILWVTGPRGRALRAQLDAAATRSGRSCCSSARSSSSTASSCSTSTSGRSRPQYWKDRMVDLGLQRGARLHDRARDPAGDRRPRLAAPARAARRSRLPRVRRLPRRVDRLRRRSTPP